MKASRNIPSMSGAYSAGAQYSKAYAVKYSSPEAKLQQGTALLQH